MTAFVPSGLKKVDDDRRWSELDKIDGELFRKLLSLS